MRLKTPKPTIKLRIFSKNIVGVTARRSPLPLRPPKQKDRTLRCGPSFINLKNLLDEALEKRLRLESERLFHDFAALEIKD